MSNSENRLFRYAELVRAIKLNKGEKQSHISEELGCTEVHVSNVANEKAVFSIERLLKLLNTYDMCMDDFVADSYKVEASTRYEDKQLFGNLSDEEILLVLEIVKKRFLEKENVFREDVCYGRFGEETKNYREIKEQNRKIGKKIKELREKKQITAAEMAGGIAIKEETYRNIESGTGTTYDNYVLIAKKLEVPVSLLFEDYVKNKKAVINYEISELFDSMTLQERQDATRLIEAFVKILEQSDREDEEN